MPAGWSATLAAGLGALLAAAPLMGGSAADDSIALPVKRAVPTVIVGGKRVKSVGTFRELVNGDRACYATLSDDNGERFDALASFSLCEREQALIGRRARLRYQVQNVLAASCAGNMDCGRSDSEIVIVEVTVLSLR